MKQILQLFKQKADTLFLFEQSTKDRSIGFRVIVGVLVGLNLFCIIFYIIKTLS
ncbi:MAG: hypothetical protein ABIT05_13925 [Chitinophagaceae bacterium]